MLLKDYLNEGVEALSPIYPSEEARSIMLMLCEYRLGTRSYTHIVEPDYAIKDKSVPQLTEDLKRLSEGEPIQYVIGRAEFCDEIFSVTPAVLIPRPETELLCREAIKIASRMTRMREAFGKSARPVRILDLCTGSGCIAWTLALNVPGAEVTGVDISEEALKVASSQDFSARLKERKAASPIFLAADVLDTEQAFDHGEFDLILSNPPYIMDSEKPGMRTNVLDHEPATALFVPDEDPLIFYRAIARWSQRFLAKDGKCMAEINELLGPQTEALFKESGFNETEIMKDLSDKDRFILYAR